ncbi:MAG: glutathione S-transferase [bacterium]|nr:glutathione S-transferase [bacterium]
MLTIMHLAHSRSDRLIWLFEELGLEFGRDYEVQTFERNPETQRAPTEMKALHPFAKAPMLRDGDRVLIESGAIFEYMMARHGDAGLVPKSSDPDWPDYIQWLHFAEGSAMLPILLDHFQAAGLAGPPGESPLAAMAKSGMEQLFAYIESVLCERTFLAGERFTAADVMMGWVVEMIDFKGELGPYPSMQRYLKAIHARPAHQRAQRRAAQSAAAGTG